MAIQKHQHAHELRLAALAVLITACADVAAEPGDEEPELSLLTAVDASESDAAPPAAPEIESDAGAAIEEADAAATPADALGDAAIDADAGSACEADWECGASGYCSQLTQQCTPRCQGATCVGPSFARDNDRLISDGHKLCFADESDVQGEYALRVWDGSSSAATTLTRAMGARALLLDEQYCYFHAADALRRAPLDGGCVELVQEMSAPPRQIWREGEHVLWQTAEAEARSYRVAHAQNAHAEAAAGASAPPAAASAAHLTLANGREIRKDARESRLIAAAPQ